MRWRPNSIVTAYNRVLCGDSEDGRIGSIEEDTYTEYGELIIRTFSTQVLSDQGNAMIMSMLEATFEAGVGDLITLDPKVRMSIAKDGKSFNNELTRSIGGIGQFDQRAIWYRLGRYARMLNIKIEMSDPVKPTFSKLEAKVRASQNGR